MFESSLQVGRIAGIRIGIHYTWLIILFLMNTSLFYVFKHQLDNWNDFAAGITAFATSIVFFISIILHELGHSVVAIRNGIEVKSITLFIFGGVASSEREADTPLLEFKIAIAGPVVSLLLALLFWYLRDWLGREGAPLYVALDWLATINLVIGLFNLIPGFPLDGGRVFRAIVWGVTGDESRGMHIAVAGGRLVAFGLMGIGVLIGFQTGNILSGIWMIGIGWFLLAAAEASLRAFSQHRVFGRLPLKAIMDTRVPRIPAQTTVEQWVSGYVLPQLERSALVEQDGVVIGIVSLSDTRELPESEWGEKDIGSIMTPVDRLHLETVDSSVEAVLKTMQENSVNQVPIADSSGIVGWVTRENLIKTLGIYSESGRD